MLAYLTPLQKLWNKGVDITAGVITSTISAGIVAVIATIFWNWKKTRDLRFEADKQRQSLSIAEEIEAAKRREAARQNRQRLAKEMEILATQAETASPEVLIDCWERYARWVDTSPLNILPRNLTTLNSLGVRIGGRLVPPTAREAARIIRNTELPAEE
jgi:hypothetical protein